MTNINALKALANGYLKAMREDGYKLISMTQVADDIAVTVYSIEMMGVEYRGMVTWVQNSDGYWSVHRDEMID